jgi:hypothetical protein
MDAWRARLEAGRRLILDDDEEDEWNVNMLLNLMPLEENDMLLPRIHRGSQPGKAANIDKDRHAMHERMIRDYFCDTLVYGPHLFRRRYRMRRSLFVTIMERVCARDAYFIQKLDACGSLGLSPHQKIT